MCDSGEVEDVPHFTQRCAALKCCRDHVNRVLATALPFTEPAGTNMLAEFQRGGHPQLRLLLSAEQGAVEGWRLVLLPRSTLHGTPTVLAGMGTGHA